MKASVLYNILGLPIAALGLAVPRSQGTNAVAGSTDHAGATIFFSTPCRGCSHDVHNDLEFELKTDLSSQACDSSVIWLNGARLAPTGHSVVRQGKLYTSASLGGAFSQPAVLSWEMSCLRDDITLLSFNILSAASIYEVREPSGFTVSLKQHGSTRFLRLDTTPVHDVNDPSLMNEWAVAEDDSNFVLMANPTVLREDFPDAIQRELIMLNELKASIGKFHHRYMRQERRIFEMIKQDFHACEGARCLFQTAVEKAPDMFELIKAHFRRRPDWDKIRVQRPFGFDGPHEFPGEPENNMPFQHDDIDGPFPADGFDRVDALFLPPHGRPHPGGPPPPPGHHHPPFFHRHGPHRHPFFFSLGSILVFVSIASLLFRCVRAQTGLFRDNRRNRDRAARREERRSRAAYRRAAMQHRWKNWWSHLRRPQSTADYEEKRARILDQEGALEDVMQSEIRDLRRAHEMVGDMMRAEESRQRLYHEANFGARLPTSTSVDPSPSGESDSGGFASSTTATLPAYQPPPPSYEHELEGDMMVVDGFMYTPSNSDSTPESSVVDCNSRLSFDTSTTTTKD